MRKNRAAEAILTKYMEPKKGPNVMFNASRTSKKTKGSTLSDFYREVHATDAQNARHPYLNKNAAEIESMMMMNRKLIEIARSKK